MENENQQGNADASGGEGQNPPVASTPPPAAVEPTAKLEVKDGRVTVDGKIFVSESDLIAAKKSLETKMELAQTAHEKAIDAAKLEISESQKQIATLNAKIKEAEQARESGAISAEELVGVKQQLETAKSDLETANTKSLEYRRALLVMKGVPEDTIKEKSMQELDAIDVALKAMSANAGGNVGNYALGGGTPAAVPVSNMDRAKRIIESTPVRGVREPAPANPT